MSQVDFLAELFGGTVEHLVVRDCPVNATAGALLRSYLVAAMPRLLSFNDADVSPDERTRAEGLYRAMALLRRGSSAQFTNKVVAPAPASTARGAVSKSGPATAASSFLRTASFKNPRAPGDGEEPRAGQQQQPAALSELSQGALYHRRVAAEFEAAFEREVRAVIKETIETLRR